MLFLPSEHHFTNTAKKKTSSAQTKIASKLSYVVAGWYGKSAG